VRQRIGKSVLTPIGLDIGVRTIAAAQLRVGARGREVFAAVILDRGSESVPPDSAEVERMMSVLWRHGFEGDRAVVGVPESMVLTSTLDVPAQISGAPLEAMARVEMSRSLGCRQDALEVVWWPLPVSARGRETAQLLASGCTHANATALLESVERGGLSAVRLVPRAGALSAACAPLLQDNKALCALVEIGWDSAIIAVLHEGVVIYARSHQEGSLTNLQRRMHLDLGLTIDACDQGEWAPPTAPLHSPLLEDAARVLAEHLQDVAEELTASLSYACHKYPEAAISQVLVTGPGAVLRGAGAMLADRFESQVRVAGVADVALVPACLAPTCADPALLVPVGFAVQTLEQWP
jgi:type IV pilus assembly protein PilM